jgi:protein-export membrane protein SecD/preprotein translocase SecF subunit
MTTAGRNQLLGVALFVVSLAALGGLLFYRQHCHRQQDELQAQLLTLEGDLKTAREKRDETVKNVGSLPDAKQTAKDTFKAAEKAILLRLADIESGLAGEKPKEVGKISEERLKKTGKRLEAVTPPWGWLGWPLGILPVLAFLVAHNLATEHGKRFVVTLAVAVTAVGLFYFKDPIMGIDLSGGAELRYRMETADVDEEIAQLEGYLTDLRAGGSAARAVKDEVGGEIAELQKKLATVRGKVSKDVLKEKIARLEAILEPKDDHKSLADMLAVDKRRRDTSVSMAIKVIRRRIDGAGIKQVTVRAVDGGRGLLAQLPTRNIPFDPEKGEDYQQKRQRAELSAALSEVRRMIETPGKLGLHDVDACEDEGPTRPGQTPRGYKRDAERWKQARLAWDESKYDPDNPAPQEVLPGYLMVRYVSEGRRGKSSKELLLLRKEPVVTGDDLARALASRGEEGLEVQVWLKGLGGEKMARFTKASNIKHGRDRLAVMLDGDVRTAPTIQTQLSSFFRITGRFTKAEVDRITRVLNAGSLTYAPKLLSENQVGPGLGQDSIDAGTRASLIGGALVILFMGIYYLGAGLVANFALVLNIAIILGAMNALGGTFTLPGIAGIALTLGMAVDANVLIFERIREEKLRGKPLKLAVKAGHERALVTIVDANVTTLITAFILYAFGTGAVKGFAVTLALGIGASLFTALFVTRGFLTFLVDREWVKELKMCRVVGDTKIPFMKLRPVMFAISALLVAGAIALFTITSGKDKYGLDFTGGIELQVKFKDKQKASVVREKAELARQAIERAANAVAKEGTTVKVPVFSVQSFNPDIDGTSRDFKIFCQLDDELLKLVKSQVVTPVVGEEKGAKAESSSPETKVAGKETKGSEGKDVKEYFRSAFGVDELDKERPFPKYALIGQSVAGELLRDAIMALGLSVIFIFIYIMLRFDFVVGFGLGAAAALVHDAAIALGALLVANHFGMAGARIDLVIIAALLTIIGYSLNDTIVVFDRIRENRAAQRSLGLRALVDLSVNQTLSRTLLTSVTTLLAVVSILILGGGALRPFALVFTVGVVVGTYSSVFVAAAVAVTWENWREQRREAAKKKLRSAPQGAR